MLEEYGVVKKYKDGEVIFRQGDYGLDMYVVKSGRVRIYREGEGRPVVLATLDPEEFFGEMAILGTHRRSANAKAVMESDLIVISRDSFLNLIKDPVVMHVLERLSSRIKEVDDRLEELAVEDQIRKEHISGLLTQRRNYSY